jgi:hypothetical protein
MAAGSTKKMILKGLTPLREALTIMVLKRTGTVWTGKVSVLVFIGAAVFFCSYIIATLIIIFHYVQLTLDQDTFRAQHAELSKERTSAHKELERANHQIALLETYITERREHQLAAVPKGRPVPEPSFPDLVDISRLTVTREYQTLMVTFQIVNTGEQIPLRGHVFVLARVKGSDQDTVLVYPSCSLNNGRPVDYRRGQRFVINRFKMVRSRYTFTNALSEPVILKILVYNEQGNLIFSKTVEV